MTDYKLKIDDAEDNESSPPPKTKGRRKAQKFTFDDDGEGSSQRSQPGRTSSRTNRQTRQGLSLEDFIVSDDDEWQSDRSSPKPRRKRGSRKRGDDSGSDWEIEHKRTKKVTHKFGLGSESGSDWGSQKKKRGPRGRRRKAKRAPSDVGLEEEVEQTNPETEKKTRIACTYGKKCYRRNQNHIDQFSHPGDSDYDGSEPEVPEKNEKNEKNDAISESEEDESTKKECPFGANCFRKNPQHKKEFKHTKKVRPKREAAKQAGTATCNKKRNSIYMDGDCENGSKRKLHITSKSYTLPIASSSFIAPVSQNSILNHCKMPRDSCNTIGCTNTIIEPAAIRILASPKTKVPAALMGKTTNAEKTKSEFAENSLIHVDACNGINDRKLSVDNVEKFALEMKVTTEMVCKVINDREKKKTHFGEDRILYNKQWKSRYYKHMVEMLEEISTKKEADAKKANKIATKDKAAAEKAHKMLSLIENAKSKFRPESVQIWENIVSCRKNMAAVLDKQLISSKDAATRSNIAAADAKSSLKLFHKNIDILAKKKLIFTEDIPRLNKGDDDVISGRKHTTDNAVKVDASKHTAADYVTKETTQMVSETTNNTNQVKLQFGDGVLCNKSSINMKRDGRHTGDNAEKMIITKET